MKLNINRGENNPIKVQVNNNYCMLLGVVLVIFKILEVGVVADWSWWLVLLPFYIGLAIFAVAVVGLAAVAGLVLGGAWLLDCYDSYKRKNNRRK